MTDVDPRIEKIRKLFAMAEAKGATEAERDTFREKANALMVQWAIDDAMLIAADNERLKSEKIVQVTLMPEGPTSYWYEYSTIGTRVADAVGLRGAHTKVWHNRQKRDAFVVVGFESDIKRFEMLLRSLERQCTAALAVWAKDNLKSWMDGSRKYQERRGFIQGFSRMVANRLKALREAQISEHTRVTGNGAELVLVSREEQVVNHVLNLGWRTGKARKLGDSGYTGGRSAGARADIGQNRFGTAARGALES